MKEEDRQQDTQQAEFHLKNGTYADLNRFIMKEPNIGYASVGDQIKCGHCEPTNYIHYPGVSCNCVCHGDNPIEGFEMEMREQSDKGGFRCNLLQGCQMYKDGKWEKLYTRSDLDQAISRAVKENTRRISNHLFVLLCEKIDPIENSGYREVPYREQIEHCVYMEIRKEIVEFFEKYNPNKEI